jgi:hypothetical protein
MTIVALAYTCGTCAYESWYVRAKAHHISFAAIIDIMGVVQEVQPLGEITVKSGANAGNSE